MAELMQEAMSTRSTTGQTQEEGIIMFEGIDDVPEEMIIRNGDGKPESSSEDDCVPMQTENGNVPQVCFLLYAESLNGVSAASHKRKRQSSHHHSSKPSIIRRRTHKTHQNNHHAASSRRLDDIGHIPARTRHASSICPVPMRVPHRLRATSPVQPTGAPYSARSGDAVGRVSPRSPNPHSSHRRSASPHHAT